MSTRTTALTPSQLALLPKDKHDREAVNRLRILPASTLAPLIPELLTWMQDSNWPIVEPIISLLLAHPKISSGPLRQILKGDDVDWTRNCLVYLVKELPKDCKLALRAELERIRGQPTEEERREEVDVLAGDILTRMSKETDDAD